MIRKLSVATSRVAPFRDKILRFRDHPSIALWCARSEGYPAPEIDNALRVIIPELDPIRLYQPSSTAGRGVLSHGPYYWREPRALYVYDAPFKTETGSVSVPTLESVHGMVPEKDWETINDDWAEHDLAKGAQHGDTYPYVLAGRYGRIIKLADLVRKAQMMNFESFRAMYEGRNANLFQPYTGVLTWMSHPAQPSHDKTERIIVVKGPNLTMYGGGLGSSLENRYDQPVRRLI